MLKLTNTFTKMSSIPVIGVPVVKNPVWVKRLIDSIDYPVDDVFIINNNGKGEIDQALDELIHDGTNPFIKRLRVTHMPANLGVPGSWNLIIKMFMKAPYWIISNDDVAFCPGFLKEMNETALADPNAGLIHGYSGDFNVGNWDLFLIRDIIIQQFGLFDENLYPAYNEDADYFLRFIHRPIRKVMNLKTNYLHGTGSKNEYHVHGSQTSKSDPALKEKLDKVNLMNIDYMTKKWGPGWRLCKPSATPFEQEGAGVFPIWYSPYDLEFVRSKHLGF